MFKPDLSIIIPAAGSGVRLGGNVPKPFIELDGISILERTIRCFLDPQVVFNIVIPVAGPWMEHTRTLVSGIRTTIPIEVVEGGIERMYSINNALLTLPEHIRFVAIHDAVRPFVSGELIATLLTEVTKYDAVVPCTPVTDTIKFTDESGFVTGTPDRNTLMAVQTPQIFKKELVLEAYRLAIQQGIFGTDDSSLVERLGQKVRLVQGFVENFKITWPGDIERAERLIRKGSL